MPRDLDVEKEPATVMAAQAHAVKAASDGEASVSCPDDSKADTETGLDMSPMSGVSFLSDASQGSMQPLNL
jgi:hypothetical protein